jgi:hypothetical protein
MRCLGMVGRVHWRSMISCRRQATKPSLRPMHSQDLANGLAFSGLPVVAAYQHLCPPKQAQTERAQRCMLQPMHATTAGIRCKIIIPLTQKMGHYMACSCNPSGSSEFEVILGPFASLCRTLLHHLPFLCSCICSNHIRVILLALEACRIVVKLLTALLP